MGFSSEQINSWSNQGAQTTAKNTHIQIRDVLNSNISIVRGKCEIFLQGSYKNDTNIRGDSDVDVVVSLNTSFSYDISNLSEREKSLFNNAYTDSTYKWRDFRRDVLATLRNHYGAQRVTEGNKSIKVRAGSNTVNADVVVSIRFLKFHKFESSSNPLFTEGITFWTVPDGRQIISYPKLHSDKLEEKNKLTRNLFKPTIRIFKNARSYMEDRGLIQRNIAPSYFLESLIYNVHNAYFVGDYYTNFNNALKCLMERDYSGSIFPNGMVRLFGDNDGQWNINSARQFVFQLARL